ncbi:MAG: hypothetical protein AAGJ46_21735 [Planctomycetota bacterium]
MKAQDQEVINLTDVFVILDKGIRFKRGNTQWARWQVHSTAGGKTKYVGGRTGKSSGRRDRCHLQLYGTAKAIFELWLTDSPPPCQPTKKHDARVIEGTYFRGDLTPRNGGGRRTIVIKRVGDEWKIGSKSSAAPPSPLKDGCKKKRKPCKTKEKDPCKKKCRNDKKDRGREKNTRDRDRNEKAKPGRGRAGRDQNSRTDRGHAGATAKRR